MILTAGDTLRPEAAQAIEDLAADLVIILGGTNAVSAGAQDQIGSRGVETLRLAGANRFESGVQLATVLVGFGELDASTLGGGEYVAVRP